MNHYQQERQQRANQIINQLKEQVPPILATYPVDMAYLYGSVARKRPLPTSDIDIALILREVPATGKDILYLEFAIQAALEDGCGLANFDVRTINNAPLMVRGEVVQRGILLYQRDEDVRVAFEVLTRKLYFDYLPTAKRMQQAFLRHIHQKGLSHGKSKHLERVTQQSAELSG
ncbi:nucleotidyltransferase domain-containing protein [Anaerolineales bacterium HSG24]|nr:nucleotidyltransferase domain-containing protein [Anaerolineales bacterium HSG24]